MQKNKLFFINTKEVNSECLKEAKSIHFLYTILSSRNLSHLLSAVVVVLAGHADQLLRLSVVMAAIIHLQHSVAVAGHVNLLLHLLALPVVALVIHLQQDTQIRNILHEIQTICLHNF
jgi:hypothetical protein